MWAARSTEGFDEMTMTKTFAAAAVLLSAGVPGCTVQNTPWKDPEVCRENFEAYDAAVRSFGTTYGDPDTMNGTVSRTAQDLMTDGCITRSDDLAEMEAARERLSPHRPVESGAPRSATAVHAGIVDGFSSQARVTQYFAALGYRSRSVGAQGLGRRIYIGPFYSQGAIDEAIRVARAAGFVSPYVSETKF
jgi:hypothetical protein